MNNGSLERFVSVIIIVTILIGVTLCTNGVYGNGNGNGNHMHDDATRTIKSSIAFLTTSDSVVPANGDTSISWYCPSPSIDDWIGLFGIRSPSDANHLMWQTNTRGTINGTITLSIPHRQDNYEYRYFQGSGFTRQIGRSDPILSITCPLRDGKPFSNIEHVVLIVQENHSFDSLFGNYCTAPTGSAPTCNDGSRCCEAGPRMDPGGSGVAPRELDDNANGDHDPNHHQRCEVLEFNNGAMDRFVRGVDGCSDPRNFAYADAHTASYYWDLARNYSLSDNYWQPIAGATASNNVYLIRAGYMFTDNDAFPWKAIGTSCNKGIERKFSLPNIGSLFRVCGISYVSYAGGYNAMRVSHPLCPSIIPADCVANKTTYPCTYDASDIPFNYFDDLRDNPDHIDDLDDAFPRAVRSGTLPRLSYIKPLGYKTEHPGSGIRLSDGERAVRQVVDQILSSPIYAKNTLILVTYDEGGGYFDHVSPPSDSAYDSQPYGNRIPLWAVGEFAKRGYISHVAGEHSSIVRLLQWNWFNDTGHFDTRDRLVNHITDLLDQSKTGALPV